MLPSNAPFGLFNVYYIVMETVCHCGEGVAELVHDMRMFPEVSLGKLCEDTPDLHFFHLAPMRHIPACICSEILTVALPGIQNRKWDIAYDDITIDSFEP